MPVVPQQGCFVRTRQFADFIDMSDARFESGLVSIELKLVVPDVAEQPKRSVR